MANQINSITLSNQLDQARKLMASLTNADGSLMFKNFDRAILVQHTLRSTAVLNTGATNFQLPILQNSQFGTSTTSAAQDQNLLSLQDIFCATEICLSVAKPSSLTDSAYRLYQWGDASVFTTTNTATSINGMYDSAFLKFVNNQQVIAPYWDIKRHFIIPNQQPAANAYFTSSGYPFITQIDGSTDGFYPVQPMWVFNGGGNVQVSLNLQSSLAAVETVEKVVLLIRGFLLQNASMIK